MSTTTDAERIVRARALMWQDASSDEQAKWLRQVDDFDSQLAAARQRAAHPPSAVEGDSRRLRSVDGPS